MTVNLFADEFLAGSLLHHAEATDSRDEFWWREVVGGGEGYILIWADGTYHHTYTNPENM